MGNGKGIRTLMLGAVLGAAVVLPSQVSAHVDRDASYATIRYSRGGFVGNVISGQRRCERNPAISVVKVLRGGDTRVIARTTTGGDGSSQVALPRARGRFYSDINRDVSGRYGHTHVCRGDQSRVARAG